VRLRGSELGHFDQEREGGQARDARGARQDLEAVADCRVCFDAAHHLRLNGVDLTLDMLPIQGRAVSRILHLRQCGRILENIGQGIPKSLFRLFMGGWFWRVGHADEDDRRRSSTPVPMPVPAPWPRTRARARPDQMESFDRDSVHGRSRDACLLRCKSNGAQCKCNIDRYRLCDV
jgi:hypothetical protein